MYPMIRLNDGTTLSWMVVFSFSKVSTLNSLGTVTPGAETVTQQSESVFQSSGSLVQEVEPASGKILKLEKKLQMEKKSDTTLHLTLAILPLGFYLFALQWNGSLGNII